MTDNGQRRTWRADLIGLFLLAMFVRLAMLWSAVSQLGIEHFATATPDTITYLAGAQALVDGTDRYQNAVFIFGPGFPLILSVYLRLFGSSFLPFLLLQTVISSLSCLLIYRLGRQITGDYAIGLVAGCIAALSLTSMSLSCLILSDTLYLFLFLLSLVLFIDGLRQGSWWRFGVSGTLSGIAVLTRTIGQFWPLALVAIAALLLGQIRREHQLQAREIKMRIWQVVTCVTITVLFMVGWGARNYVVNGVPALAMTSAGGPANVAAMTREAQTGVPYRTIEDSWFKEGTVTAQRDTLSKAEQYQLLRSKTFEVLRDSPLQMLSVYAGTVWENLTAREELHRDLLPPAVHPWANYLNAPNRPFILAMIGLLSLLVLRRIRPAAILGLIYLYYASMIGFTKWQGSRLFYPGLAAEAILIASFLCLSWKKLEGLLMKKPPR